ncbi:hypothetical protein GPECTOR_16g640 [Gonium pectorale]|uniref:CASP C-terminal domain-containing protein n=1 Tax=Gonium pectorale TaxID=33097 RepID=A0A150GKT6_GONPE|nr:hypothetical protein GPECTOR_16g640 [Gonium pectorale]|eukprot:KXZ50466.1 hypothetical protein GPECTOR_16g640 [Gonium pectorale]
MNFLKTLDQALDFERLEKTVTEKVQQAALSVVEEFPDRKAVSVPTSITSAVLVEARELFEQWQAYEFERRKDEWEAACGELKVLRGQEESSHAALQAWQRRAQDAEFKLYQLCSSLLALPDPTPFLNLLSTMAARVQDLEENNRKLHSAAEKAAADDAEVTRLIGDHQKLLESTKELQEMLAQRDARIVEMSSAAAEAAMARQEMTQQAAEMARLQRALKSVKDEYETTQASLFELQSRLESLAGSRQQEAELAGEELERVTKRAAELELERQHLLSRLESAKQAVAAEGGGALVSGVSGSADVLLLERQLAVREEQLSTTKLALERLEREVARRPDPREYQELRRRAEALQSLVDVQMQAEGWSGEQVEATLRDPSAQTVTAVLQERTRKLSSEVNSLKRQLAERAKQTQDLEGKIQSLESDLRHRSQLVAQLEEHLAAAARAAASTNAAGDGGAAATSASTGRSEPSPAPVSPHPGRADSLLPQLSGSLGVLPTVEPASPSQGMGGTAAAGAGADGAGAAVGGSLLDIVVSQRDRFRQRMVQLEDEKSQLSEELRKTTQQLQTVRNDNVALFEKVRYLERYNQKLAASGGRTTVVRVDAAGVAAPSPEDLAASARGSRYQCGPFALEVGGGGGEAMASHGSGFTSGSGIAGGRFGGTSGPAVGTGIRSRGGRRGGANQVLSCFGEGDDVENASASTAESRAARAYEARVNPFAEFQQSEAELRVRNLQVHDRAVLAGSKLLLGSRVARMFFALYTVMLHFVILLLFFYATTPCPAAASDVTLQPAMAAAAAGAAAAGMLNGVG